eukprot:jgi/Picre1/32667/NNA_008013.t1
MAAPIWPWQTHIVLLINLWCTAFIISVGQVGISQCGLWSVSVSRRKNIWIAVFAYNINTCDTQLPVAATDDSSVNKAAEAKQEASAESCFNDYLIQAEGDVEMAAEIVAEKMKEGEVKAGTGLSALVEYVGVGLFMRSGLSSVVQESLQGMHGVDARRVSLKAVVGMALENGKAVEPFLMSLLSHVLGCFDAKESDVREAAEKAGSTLMKKLNAHATTGIIETLLQFMTKTNKWQIRVGALKCLDTRASEFPAEMGHSMHKLIPSLSEAVVDSRMEVAETAKKALLACCYAAGNRDLDPNVPATMEDACMAVLVPIMDRALKERSTKTQRRACIIIENMSKLVLDPVDARPFLPVLIPALDKVSDQAADPELRDVAARASGALKKIRDEDEAVAKVAGIAASKEEVFKELSVLIDKADFPADAAPAVDSAAAYVANVCASLIRSHIHGPRSWDSACFEYLNPASGDEEKTKELTVGLRKWALTHMGEVVQEEEEFDDEPATVNSVLRMPRYSASVSETPVVDFIFEDEVVQEAQSPSREKVIEVLAEVGFSDQLQAAPIASLSGGWRMKLALARAMLIGADILLLDEPTNHMDTTNVAWLVDYLTKKTDISSMIVSHDSGFLDDVCTDIIHYEKRKLVHYVGNLSEFVKVKPEAKAYYELSAAAFKFTFPEPGFLDGVKGKRQPVIRVVAVIGRNGAGKSTLIKVITGETLPTEGTVWRHPNLRIAYVAQHAFHHIEDHLEKTPAQYIWWRFGDGEDREAKEKATRKLTDEEIKAREDAIAAGKRVVDFLNSRRMGNKSKEYEYEVQWYGQSSRENVWYTRTKLVEEMGLGKLVEEMDAKIANFRNYRALSNPMVIQHLKDFGLEEEIAAHNMIRGLSGGQKVKLVLAAAMWCQPHLLVLDEPTNYLDRDSLGALASGIKEYNGGVLMISHNNEFTSALCSEEWIVADGKVTVKGQQISEVPSVQSLASMTTASSVASLSTLGGESVEDDEHLDGAALEEKLKAKEERRLKKERLAAEKAAKKAEKARLKFLKKF